MTDDADIRFVPVCQPGGAIQAGMIREALQQAGVNCYVENETFSMVRLGGGAGTGLGAMRAMVPADQVDRARAIIAELDVV